jgi:hypothetical protein
MAPEPVPEYDLPAAKPRRTIEVKVAE